MLSLREMKKHPVVTILFTLLLLFTFSFTPVLAEEIATSTPTDITPASITDITTTAVPPNSLKIDWMTDEPAVYTFEYGTSQAYGSSATMAVDPSIGGTATLTTLLYDTTYYYCIHATDASSNISNSCDSFVTGPKPDTTSSIISGVANELLVSTSTKIVWVTDEPAFSKLRYGKTESLGSETTLDTTSTLLHDATLSGLTPNTKYYFCIDATDVAGNRSDSCGHTFTTAAEMPTGDIAPPVVTLLAVSSITQTSAKITWTTDERTKVQVQYGLTIDYGTVSNLSRDYTSSHTVNLYRLKPATLYHYRVRSVDRAGNVSLSEDQTFTTASPPPPTTPTVVPPPPPPSYVDGASESGPVRTEQIRNYRRQSSEVSQKINALPSTAEANVMIPVLFGVGRNNISPNFGDPRSGGRLHEGEDIMAVKGTPIVSPTPAVVLRTVVGPTEGITVYTANPGGETFVYMHLDRYGEGVVPGLVLERGSLIGYVGNTGNASGGAAHLHFEIHNSGNPVDPYPRLTGEFSPQDKITYLNKILTQTSDPTALSNFLVINFRSSFTTASAGGVNLPQLITNSLAAIPASTVTYSSGGVLPAGDLSLGSSGAGVVSLQKYLIGAAAGPAAARLAQAGPTGAFGPMTQAALVEFQSSAGISPAAGYYGPTTRGYVNSHPLGTSQPSEPTNPSDSHAPVTLTRDLYLGLTGEDVRLLQKFLNSNGYAVAQTGAGSPGNESTYFGSLTEAAVIRFQTVKGIKPTAGYVGPITRAAMAI